MRVAALVHTFPKRSETFILSQLNWLISRGHDVQVLAHGRGGESEYQSGLDPHGLAENVRYVEPLGHSLVPQCVRYLPEWMRLAAQNSPMALRALNPQGAVGLRVFLQRPVWASAIAGNEPPDIIHCHFGTLQHLGLALLRVCPPTTRLAVSIRGRDITAVVKQYGAGVYRDLFDRGHVFLPCCDALGDRLREAGCPPERIRMLHCALDIDQLAFTPRTWTPGTPLQLVTAGRAVEKKGFDIAVRAIARVRESNLDARLTIFGDGPMIDQLRADARELGIEDHITFTGAYERSDFEASLKNAHMFLLPSRIGSDGDQEGIPNTGKEAMALGLPVVGTDHSGIGELVRDGETGVLVEQNDAAALADGIIRLANQPESWGALTERARRVIEDEYTPAACNPAMEDAFKFALALPR